MERSSNATKFDWPLARQPPCISKFLQKKEDSIKTVMGLSKKNCFQLLTWQSLFLKKDSMNTGMGAYIVLHHFEMPLKEDVSEKQYIIFVEMICAKWGLNFF